MKNWIFQLLFPGQIRVDPLALSEFLDLADQLAGSPSPRRTIARRTKYWALRSKILG